MKHILILIACIPLILQGQDPTEMIRKSEERARGIKSLKATVKMTIVRPEWSREMQMTSWQKGDDLLMIFISAPARDKGTAYLKRDKEVWNWLPTIERSVKLPPSAMAQSWMGSDFTNEDLVREFSLVKDYSHRLLGDTTLEGRKCYKIELIPNEGAAVVWGKIYMWISEKDLLQLRSEFYDEDGYLINVMQASKIKQMDDRMLPTYMEMIPVEEEGQKTVLEYLSMEFDDPISDNFFTTQQMKRIR
ncbi:MAG: outer membrane lipoprotein-sorting protein [Bacteroidota bacterium]